MNGVVKRDALDSSGRTSGLGLQSQENSCLRGLESFGAICPVISAQRSFESVLPLRDMEIAGFERNTCHWLASRTSINLGLCERSLFLVIVHVKSSSRR
jgi:hypothetical protein